MTWSRGDAAVAREADVAEICGGNLVRAGNRSMSACYFTRNNLVPPTGNRRVSFVARGGRRERVSREDPGEKLAYSRPLVLRCRAPLSTKRRTNWKYERVTGLLSLFLSLSLVFWRRTRGQTAAEGFPNRHHRGLKLSSHIADAQSAGTGGGANRLLMSFCKRF